MNYKQKKLEEFDDNYFCFAQNIEGKLDNIFNFKRIKELKLTREGIEIHKSELKKFLSQTIDEILSCLSEKKCLHELTDLSRNEDGIFDTEKSSRVCIRESCNKYFRDEKEWERDVYENIGFNECRRQFLDNLEKLNPQEIRD